ncbi:MAG: transposase [Anaerolineae bacterium]|nr:transposase [Anaerolineae bacterium]
MIAAFLLKSPEGETQDAWEELLIALDSRGVYRQSGLELLIHDGGAGLQAALQQVYPHIPQQRCLFHKLRNLRQAIVAPSALSPSQERTFKSDFMRLLRPIFQASDLQHARHLTDIFCSAYRHSQPKLVSPSCRIEMPISLSSASWRVSPPGRAVSFAPPASSNGSIAPSAVSFALLGLLIPPPACSPLSLVFWLLIA